MRRQGYKKSSYHIQTELSKKIQFRCTPEFFNKVGHFCIDKKITIQALCTQVLDRYIDSVRSRDAKREARGRHEQH